MLQATQNRSKLMKAMAQRLLQVSSNVEIYIINYYIIAHCMYNSVVYDIKIHVL